MSIKTRAGELQCSRRHHALIATLQRHIQPGDSLFVFPYLPVIYFVTGVNPLATHFFNPE